MGYYSLDCPRYTGAVEQHGCSRSYGDGRCKKMGDSLTLDLSGGGFIPSALRICYAFIFLEGAREMIGKATEIEMCGETIRLGDEMEVEYTTGRRGRVKGKVIELWSPEISKGHLQARLSCGWCFHNHDRIISHVGA